MDCLESRHFRGQRAASDFVHAWRRFARILQLGIWSDLPTGVNPIGEPHFSFRLRRGKLPGRWFTVGMIVRRGRHCSRRYTFSVPDRGEPNKVGVETSPAVVAKI